MAGKNLVILLGRIGRNPELNYTNSGLAICKFSLATSRKDKIGNETTQWHRCTAFDKRAEVLAKYIAKGSQLYIEGTLQYGQYEKEGVTHNTSEITVNTFEFIGNKSTSNTGVSSNKPVFNEQDIHSRSKNNSGDSIENIFDPGTIPF